MKFRVLVAFAVIGVLGCAPYKQLKPKPLLSPAEAGYFEIKNDQKLFKLKKEKRYYINFPSAAEDNFYIVIDIKNKDGFSSFMVDSYAKKKMGNRLKDETPDPAKQSVFPVGKSVFGYFWMIEGVRQDMDLSIQYRYAPQWRFKFETKHAEYKRIYEANLVDRSNYKNLGTTFKFENFNFVTVIDSVSKKAAALDAVHKELLAIESIFPPRIVNSTDKAYLDYKDLRGKLDDEIAFQANYLAVLGFFNTEFKTRNDVPGLLNAVEDFITYFSKKQNFPANVLKESQVVIGRRLSEIPAHYDKLLGSKVDGASFTPDLYYLKQLGRVPALYDAAGVSPDVAVTALIKFIGDYDKAAKSAVAARDSLDKIVKAVADFRQMPSETFFPSVVARVTNVQKSLAQPLGSDYGKYAGLTCTGKLNDDIKKIAADIDSWLGKYRDAERVVPQVNGLINGRDYRNALGILKQYSQLDFLLDKYRKVDTLSVQSQDAAIEQALAGARFAEAETGLKGLHGDNTFLYPANIVPLRDHVVNELEDSLYIIVDRVSRARIDKFLVDNVDTLENIDSLYKDSVFLPAYDVTFATGGKKELYQRKTNLIADLAKIKDNEFPAKAITLVYEQFLKNPDDPTSVARGRAVVAHGKHYKGDDEKIKRRAAECDPYASKWITEPKEYRRVYVLPVNEKKKSANKYFFRLNVRVPSEAQFPVYDVNIKLPKEIAQNAGQTQWFDKIMMNDKLIKAEGRVSIIAPSAENNYECQVTPVSVNKDGNNYLDIYFDHPAFKVFTVSVMVQKPIIKKN